MVRTVRFGMVGVLNFLIDFGVFNLLLTAFKATSGPTLLGCNALAFLSANLNSYLLNKKWTFQDHNAASSRQYFQFLTYSCGGLAVNSLVVYLLTTVWSAPQGLSTFWWANAAEGCASIFTLAWNYCCYRFRPFPPAATRMSVCLQEATARHPGVVPNRVRILNKKLGIRSANAAKG